MIWDIEEFFLAAWLVPSAATQLSHLASLGPALRNSLHVQSPGQGPFSVD
jgi:hypothetical protein